MQLGRIYQMHRGAGIQVEALIDYVSLFQQGEATAEARKQILIEQRDQLLERLQEMQATWIGSIPRSSIMRRSSFPLKSRTIFYK